MRFLGLFDPKEGEGPITCAQIDGQGPTVNATAGACTVSTSGAGVYAVGLPNFVGDGKDVVILSCANPGDGSGGQVSWSGATPGTIAVTTHDKDGVAADRLFCLVHFRVQ